MFFILFWKQLRNQANWKAIVQMLSKISIQISLYDNVDVMNLEKTIDGCEILRFFFFISALSMPQDVCIYFC